MIEVFADIWCPFAYVVLHMTRQRRDALSPDTTIVVRAWPLELVNGQPEDVVKTADHIRALREEMSPTLFGGFDPHQFPTTSLPALGLAVAARREGGGREAVDWALREALWEHGRDIGDERVVADVAEQYELTVTDADRDAVVSDWREGERRSVKGSPHLFCEDRNLFAAGLSIDHDDDGATHVARDDAGLDAFLEKCWR